MDEYRCYSDASYRAGKPAGFGIIVVVRTCDKWIVHKQMGGQIQAMSSTDAELKAMLIALKFVPSVSRGIAYSDLSGIQRLVAFTCSYAKKHKEALIRLNAELHRTGLVVRYEDRKHRSFWYTECHRMARKALGLPKRSSRSARKVKVEKWWTIRQG